MILRILTGIFFLLFAQQSLYKTVEKHTSYRPQEQDTVGTAAQNLDLHAAMGAFQQAPTVQAFEQALNSPETAVNNIDLNKDGVVDYIRVVDHREGDHHAIALRAAVSSTEEQDVASLLVEKKENGEVFAQMVGDPALYGKNAIVEPAARAENKNYMAGKDENIAGWTAIQNMYSPDYTPWVSPFKWNVYPENWKARKVLALAKYQGAVQGYKGLFTATKKLKMSKANKLYNRNRIAAPSVLKNKAIDKAKDKIKNPLKH